MRIFKTELLVKAGLLLASLCFCISANAQQKIDSVLGKIDPQKYATVIFLKSQRLEEKIARKSLRVLDKLQEREVKTFKKLFNTKDSLLARQKLDEIKSKYAALKEKTANPLVGSISHYIPRLDSLNISLKFLTERGYGKQFKAALDKTNSLQEQFSKAEEIKKFISVRKVQLKEQLEKLGMTKQLKSINKQVYYYSQQINEYKEILKDPRKVEKKALELLSKTKLFKDFMRRNSMLSTLFRLPPDPDDPSTVINLAGLQTRAQVNTLILQQVGPNGARQIQQNLQSAQAEMNTLKNKILAAGGSSSGDEMPDFKPNSQKTKSFLRRLEYGANVQSQKASTYFPVTSDIGLSLGYKLNDKSIIGFGISYKVGWGRNWNNISITHQGLGLRSFIDVKLKGNFWISGGYEQNYRTAFREFSELKNMSSWQQSGLIGISRVFPVKSKFFKKTSIKLLWDFLNADQVPRTPPVLFRIGYQF